MNGDAHAQEKLRQVRRFGKEKGKEKELSAKWKRYREKTSTLHQVLEGLSFRADAGWTNTDGDRTVASGVEIDLDETQFVGGFNIGFFGRPIARDVALRVSDGLADEYAGWAARGKTRRYGWDSFKMWGLVDAFKLDFYGGWGSVVNDPQGDDNSTTDTRGRYTVRLRWEIPLTPSQESPNPFD